MYFFTADQHYGHIKILEYCNRPFSNIQEMDETLIKNHNRVVSPDDIVIHAGDFTLKKKYYEAMKYINRLNGINIFLMGSHDRWFIESERYIWEHKVEGQIVVVCHYPLRVWSKSHYNSWNLFGHSHGRLEPIGKQWDIGVDNNAYYPLSFDQLKIIMSKRPNNPNLAKEKL